MSKFKVGDKVRVNIRLTYDQPFGLFGIPQSEWKKKKVRRVEFIEPDTQDCKLSGSEYWWPFYGIEMVKENV